MPGPARRGTAGGSGARGHAEAHLGGRCLTQEDADSLRSVGIALDAVLEHLVESFGSDAVPQRHARRGWQRFLQPAKKDLELALREAIWLKAGAIGSEHILLGLLRCEDRDINAVLTERGVRSEKLPTATLRTIGRAACD